MNAIIVITGIIQLTSLSAMVVVIVGFHAVHCKRTELLRALGSTHTASLILERWLLIGTYLMTTILLAWATTAVVLVLPLRF